MGLTRSGFTEAQAAAIADTVQETANDALETLGRELARWHAYLALYLLAQVAIVLLTILMAQAIQEPSRGGSHGASNLSSLRCEARAKIDF